MIEAIDHEGSSASARPGSGRGGALSRLLLHKRSPWIPSVACQLFERGMKIVDTAVRNRKIRDRAKQCGITAEDLRHACYAHLASRPMSRIMPKKGQDGEDECESYLYTIALHKAKSVLRKAEKEREYVSATEDIVLKARAVGETSINAREPLAVDPRLPARWKVSRRPHISTDPWTFLKLEELAARHKRWEEKRPLPLRTREIRSVLSDTPLNAGYTPKSYPPTIKSTQIETSAGVPPGPAALSIFSEEDAIAIRLSLSRLSEQERRVLLLHCVVGQTQAEIGRGMSVTQPWACNLLRSAKNNFKKHL
jgi:RNA polymerase sigma factor (sigma-70 family)